MGHMLSIESRVHQDHSARLYKTGRLLKYLTVRKETKTKRRRGEQQIK